MFQLERRSLGPSRPRLLCRRLRIREPHWTRAACRAGERWTTSSVTRVGGRHIHPATAVPVRRWPIGVCLGDLAPALLTYSPDRSTSATGIHGAAVSARIRRPWLAGANGAGAPRTAVATGGTSSGWPVAAVGPAAIRLHRSTPDSHLPSLGAALTSPASLTAVPAAQCTCHASAGCRRRTSPFGATSSAPTRASRNRRITSVPWAAK